MRRMQGRSRGAIEHSLRIGRHRTVQSTVVCTVAMLLAAGCVDNKRDVASYRKVIEGPSPIKVPQNFTAGQPLTLEAALILANRSSEQLSIQGETYLQGLIARDRAYAAFLPTISLAPTLDWQNKPFNTATLSSAGTGGTTGGGTVVTSTSGSHRYTALNVPVTAHANLFNGFRDYATVQAAYADLRRRKGLLLDLQQTVLLETAQTYYNVLLAERSVEVLQSSLEYQDARVRDMEGRMRAGIAQPLDVAQSQAQAAATRVELISARNNVRDGRIVLAFLTDADVEHATLVDRLRVPEKLMPPEQAVEIAERSRPDLAAARAAVEVARQNVQVAVGEYYPSISLDLNYYLHRETFPGNIEWAGLLTANLPIFSAGVIEADVRLAWSQLRQQLYSLWGLVRQVNQDVQVDWQNLHSSRERIAELRVEVDASQEAYRQASQRYQAGLAINLDVLNAQSQLLSSQLNLATEEFNYKIYFLDLLRVMGQLVRPASLDSMSSGPATRPTTAEIRPVLPGFGFTPAGKTPAGAETQPATRP